MEVRNRRRARWPVEARGQGARCLACPDGRISRPISSQMCFMRQMLVGSDGNEAFGGARRPVLGRIQRVATKVEMGGAGLHRERAVLVFTLTVEGSRFSDFFSAPHFWSLRWMLRYVAQQLFGGALQGPWGVF